MLKVGGKTTNFQMGYNMSGIALTSQNPVLSENIGFDKGENYYFYDALSGQSPHLYQNLIASAELRIIIWDPFFMEE